MSIDVSTIPSPAPKAPLRRQRQQARIAAVTREGGIETLVPLVRDTLFEETNALTLALRDTCEHPPGGPLVPRPTPQGLALSPAGRDRDRVDEVGGRSLVVRR